MNDKIREEIHAELRRLGWSKAELARRLSKPPKYTYDMFAKDNTSHQKGKVSPNWLKMLDYFGYELVIVKKAGKKNE